MKSIINSTDEITSILEVYAKQSELVYTDDQLGLVNILGIRVNELLQQGPYYQAPLLRRSFIHIGATVMKLCHPTPEVFADFLLQKHTLYGSEPILKYGPLGVIIKIDAKLGRVKNMISGAADYAEPMSDSLLDILGYSVLGYLALKYWSLETTGGVSA